MKAIKNSLNIDDTYTKLYRRPKLPASQQNHVKDNTLMTHFCLVFDLFHGFYFAFSSS